MLAGGAIGSPHLLLLSGVGPADHLVETGIDVVQDMPGVGRNLRDHPQVSVKWRTREGYRHDTNNATMGPDHCSAIPRLARTFATTC